MAEISEIDPRTLKQHPKAKVFPDLPEEDWNGLRESIRELGIQVPICVVGRRILCGHNRTRAALEIGLPSIPVIDRSELSEVEQIVHMVEENLKRRHLDKSQRAIIAGDPDVRKAFEATARQRQVEAGSQGKEGGRPKKPAPGEKKTLGAKVPQGFSRPRGPRTRDILAQKHTVSPKLVDQATLVYERAPELVEDIRQGKVTVSRVAGEIRRKDKATATQKALEQGMVEFKRLFKLQLYDVWSFQGLTPGFGKPHPGNLPAELIANLLYYFTDPGDLIVDPMAGGGVTGDVCKALGRNYVMADAHPHGERTDIRRHRIEDGPIPDTKGKAHLVFLDPPYWSLKREDYAKDTPSSLPWPQWIKWLRTMAKTATGTVRENGYVAVLMQDNLTKDVEAGRWAAPSTLETQQAFIAAGLTPEIQIAVPLSTQQVNAREVEWAKLNKRLLGIHRTLLIYRKK